MSPVILSGICLSEFTLDNCYNIGFSSLTNHKSLFIVDQDTGYLAIGAVMQKVFGFT
jgi:hypothetical protein